LVRAIAIAAALGICERRSPPSITAAPGASTTTVGSPAATLPPRRSRST
jgi:hypothetical protein